MQCVCQVCGKSFYNRKRKLKSCSPECKKILIHENTKRQMAMPGAKEKIGLSNRRENSGSWKGGHSPKTYQSIAFDDYKFEKKCTICGAIKKISIHHKDRNKNNNSKENLMVVCDACHKRIHISAKEMGTGILSYKPNPKIVYESVAYLYKDGVSIQDIANYFGYTPAGIRYALHAVGIDTPPFRHNDVTMEMIYSLIASGLSVRQTAIRLGVTHTWIRNHIKKDKKENGILELP